MVGEDVFLENILKELEQRVGDTWLFQLGYKSVVAYRREKTRIVVRGSFCEPVGHLMLTDDDQLLFHYGTDYCQVLDLCDPSTDPVEFAVRHFGLCVRWLDINFEVVRG